MRTSRLLAVVIAATLAAFTTNAQADWVDDFTIGEDGQTWLLAGQNGSGISGAGGIGLESFGMIRDTASHAISFTGGDFTTASSTVPVSLLGYVSQSFQDVTVSSVIAPINIDAGSGIAVRMNPSLDGVDGLLGGYSFSVWRNSVEQRIVFSLNVHEGTGSLNSSRIRSLVSAEYEYDFTWGQKELGDVSMSLTAVGNQLVAEFSFDDAAGDAWGSDVLTVTDPTYSDGFSGIVSYAYNEGGTQSPSVIGAAHWGPVTSVTAVPEPGTMLALSLLGGGGAAYKRYRSRRQPAAQPAA